MATISDRTEERRLNPVIILILIAGAVAALAVAVGTLPMTKHAQRSHQNDEINAVSLSAMITAGTCRDIEVYDCPLEATIKVLCKVGNKTWGGLIIGINGDGTQHIITGYSARRTYWERNVHGCRYVGTVLP